ncbi:MAG TPA: methyl-accepting chemotaxis protein [Pseudolabrys sp.]
MKTIKAKLLAVFTSLIIALSAIGGAGWYAAKVANDGLYTVFKDRVEPLRDLKQVSDFYGVNIVDTAHKVRNGNLDWSAGQKAVTEATVGIQKYWKSYSDTYMEPNERNLANEAARFMTAGDSAARELAEIFSAKDKSRLDKFVTEKLYAAIDPISNSLGKLVDLQIQVASDQYQSSSEKFSYARSGMIATFFLGALVLSIFLRILLVQVLKPIASLTVGMRRLAEGDFTVIFPSTGRQDEIGDITGAASRMSQKVSSTIGEIKLSGREVTNASTEISTSTTDLSQRTEEQAASLEETSAAMEQLSATVKKNSENAQSASQSASNTKDVADRGGQVVARAVEAMAKIEDSSRKISDIIGVIDEIARQTNLLALNAAVEAARAGEAGRGFAVVASEVRSLAQRSSQAAKDINDLITNSNSQVKEGVDLVNRAGESLSEIVESIKSVATIVADIAHASIEQSTGIQDINRALGQMDEVTQQNSALVEENAATAKTLEGQAKAMDERVAFFKIGDNTAHVAQWDSEPEQSPVTAPSRGPAAKLRAA